MKKIYVFLLLCALCLAGCDGGSEESGSAAERGKLEVSVETTLVTGAEFVRTRAYVGDISASKQVRVIPLATERILRFPWENGDFVRKGEVIAEIRNELSRKGFEALNAQVRNVDTQLQAAEREVSRLRSLYDSNLVTQQQYDQAQDGLKALLASKQQILATQEQTKLGLDYARVVAPIDGVVSMKSSEVGDLASSAMPLCVLLDMETLKVTINANEGDMQYLRVGQEVRMRFDAYPGEVVVAKVTRILPYVNTMSRTNTVEAEFENVKMEEIGQYRYKPGMFTRVEIELGRSQDIIVVPSRALLLEPELLEQQADGRVLRRVFVLQDDNTVLGKVVETGERSGGLVEVLKGLDIGERLVIRGHHSLRDGDKVRVRETQAPVVAQSDLEQVVEG
ncbi:MAG: efflux RND transporter periplasmic adaptor subunit [Proteobacteria bacterium]|nr:efflux RND transporter periplasmic adaptor subunit [Pseudomonadota bacterium]